MPRKMALKGIVRTGEIILMTRSRETSYVDIGKRSLIFRSENQVRGSSKKGDPSSKQASKEEHTAENMDRSTHCLRASSTLGKLCRPAMNLGRNVAGMWFVPGTKT